MTNWERVVREHGEMVFRTAWRVLGNIADSEDVVQDVYLEVHRIQQQHKVTSWGGLLRRLTTYRALDRLRQRRDTHPLDDVAVTSSVENPESVAMCKELSERLRQVLAQLPQREGTVFCMRYFEDLSYQEIADTLDISPGAVATALHKARHKLETLLTGVAKGEEP